LKVNVVANVQTWRTIRSCRSSNVIKEMSKRGIFEGLNVSDKTSLQARHVN